MAAGHRRDRGQAALYSPHGATVIWITPFYLTPFLDEGYDVSDHLQVDPRFGKLADIIAFIEQARSWACRLLSC